MRRAAQLLVRRQASGARAQSSGMIGGPPRGGAAPPPRAPARPAEPPPRPVGIIDANGNVMRSRPAPVPAAATSAGAAGAAGAGGAQFIAPSTVVVDVTESTFMELVVQCPVPVVLHATASWSQPCKTLGPKLEGVARAAKGAIRLARLDVDVARQLASQLNVRSAPTVFGIVGGRAVASFEGAATDAQLREFFDQLLAAGEQSGAIASPTAKASAAVTAAHKMVDDGRHAEALTMLPQLVGTLQTMRERTERSLRAAAEGGDKAAAQAVAAAGTSGTLYELAELAARAIGCVGAHHLGW